MISTHQNRLVPVLVALLLAAMVYALFKEHRATATASTPMSPHVNVASDADTPADTIKTLTANVAAMTAALDTLRQDNTALKKDNQSLAQQRTQLGEQLTQHVNQALATRDKHASAEHSERERVLSTLSARVDALADSVATIATPHANDIPVGLGLDSASNPEALTWIEPLDATSPPTTTRSKLAGLAQSLTEDDAEHTNAPNTPGNDKPSTVTPVYTVPRNATLMNATAMTALVGRIPVQGQVRDAMPFKVITGADNLAANGLTIPGVHGMVWSGTAVGDWTLSCVTGRLESVTFVFDDGTIRTISADDPTLEHADNKKSLAWISDAHGIPCISGTRKTNAPAFLAERIGVTAIGAAANAAASAQTTTSVSEFGSSQSTVTGNTGPYVLGKTLAGGSDEIAKWLLARQAQSFDAIFVPAGQAVAIHVDHELLIDLDTHGRKLAHAELANANVHPDLD